VTTVVTSKTVFDLAVGETAYTVPWAVQQAYDPGASYWWLPRQLGYEDRSPRVWFEIRGDYTVHAEPGGTVCLKVTRTTPTTVEVEVVGGGVLEVESRQTPYPAAWQPLEVAAIH
jgi:hypothetical protein